MDADDGRSMRERMLAELLGGGVIVCPGVTIGADTVVARVERPPHRLPPPRRITC